MNRDGSTTILLGAIFTTLVFIYVNIQEIADRPRADPQLTQCGVEDGTIKCITTTAAGWKELKND